MKKKLNFVVSFTMILLNFMFSQSIWSMDYFNYWSKTSYVSKENHDYNTKSNEENNPEDANQTSIPLKEVHPKYRQWGTEDVCYTETFWETITGGIFGHQGNDRVLYRGVETSRYHARELYREERRKKNEKFKQREAEKYRKKYEDEIKKINYKEKTYDHQNIHVFLQSYACHSLDPRTLENLKAFDYEEEGKKPEVQKHRREEAERKRNEEERERNEEERKRKLEEEAIRWAYTTHSDDQPHIAYEKRKRRPPGIYYDRGHF